MLGLKINNKTKYLWSEEDLNVNLAEIETQNTNKFKSLLAITEKENMI